MAVNQLQLPSNHPNLLLQQGQTFFQQGTFLKAIQSWKAALKQSEQTTDQIDILIHLATAYQALGDYTEAQKILELKAKPLAERNNTHQQLVLIYSHLGDIKLANQQPEKAQQYFEQGLKLIQAEVPSTPAHSPNFRGNVKPTIENKKIAAPLIQAHLLNNLGNVWSVQQTDATEDWDTEQAYSKAIIAYQKAVQLAQRQGDKLLQIQALSNQIQAHIKANEKIAVFQARLSIQFEPPALISLKEKVQNNLQQSDAVLGKAITLVHELPNSYNKAFQLLSLGHLALHLQQCCQQDQQALQAYQLFNQVLQLAKQQQDNYLMAYADGFLGELYESQQRYQEALQLTRQAIFFAQEDPELLSRWELQLGRILQKKSATSCEPQADCSEKQQVLAEAITAYRQARDHLHPIQTQMLIGQRNSQEVFREQIRPIYFGLADVLLQQAILTTSPDQKAKLLEETIKSVELLKESELQEYFQNECLLIPSKKSSSEEKALTKILVKNTAILYPILLPNRTELLLSFPDGHILQQVVPISFDQLEQTIRQFRNNIQDNMSNRFIIQARQLYDWLILPLKEQLLTHKINTLVIVPDGPLRTVPISAFFNNTEKQFLIHEFAIATIPGINLTEPHPLPRENIQVLLNGLSKAVQNFSAIPNVEVEIDAIAPFFQQKNILLNSQFTLSNISQALQSKTSYSIVHIASHGQFRRDPKDTFLLVYDSKLTMNKLEGLIKFDQRHKTPVELLTLSACQTA
ncbi:TPR repeat containing protein [Beggiatoa sp. PS]|nr:TPR repeat containing protein [Beggiatoa sp. PS]